MENYSKILDNIRIFIFIQIFLNNSNFFYQKQFCCCLTILKNEKFVKYVNRKISKGIVDLNSCVVISMATSLKLGIYNGNWILGEFKAIDKSIKRWIQVFVDYFMKEESVCFISNCLFSNLLFDDEANLTLLLHSKFSNKFQTLCTIWKKISEISTKSGNLNDYNKSIIRNAVKADISPLDLSIPDHILYENYMKSFFQTPKFVCVGDIIEIDIPLAVSYVANSKLDQLIPPSCLKFYVESLQGELLPTCGACINSKTTILAITRKSTIPLERISRRMNSTISHYLEKHINNIVRHIYTCKPVDIVDNAQSENHQVSRIERANWCGVCLLIGPSGSGKIDVIIETARILGFQVKWLDAYSMRGDTTGSTEAKICKALKCKFPRTFLIITNITALSKNKDGVKDSRAMESLKEEMEQLSIENSSAFVIGTAKKNEDVADEIWTLFTYHEIIKTPDLEERKNIIKWVAQHFLEDRVLEERLVNDISHRGGGFLLGDYKELFARVALKLKEMEESSVNLYDICISIITEMKAELSASLNLPKIPSVNWQDVGGLEEVKKELVNTIQLPILYPHMISPHLKRSGVLLFGPPGTGKTMLAKSVAHECGLNFMSVKGPELLDMYVGQSEANVRKVFRKAREASPCVIFFDELDSLAPNRGRAGDSGGVMDRIVSALLAELDIVASTSQVFVLAATNRPDLLDPALLRPGRFDKQLFINIAKEKEERLKVLNAVFSKVPLKENVDLREVLNSIPTRLSGADFYSLALDAFYLAAERIITDIEAGLLSEDAKVEVSEDDIVEVAKKIRPSVTEEQLKEYQSMQINFS